jgi:uncharacterized protein DUF6538/carbohydrate-selective porin (OprB family)
MRNPSYIVKNHNGIYYFRYVIPKAHLHLFPLNSREFRRSLKTRSRSESLRRAKVYWVKLMENKVLDFEEDMSGWQNKLKKGVNLIDSMLPITLMFSPWTGFMNFNFSTGASSMFIPNDAAFGIAYNWGKPNDSSFSPDLDNQQTIELFHRFQLAERLAITPDIQYVKNPALSPICLFLG